MKDRFRKAMGLALLGQAALVYYVHSRPLPVADPDVAEGVDAQLWSFTTEDGVTLRGKRYAQPGGHPIILAHGITGNGLEFDIPVKGHNLAVYLARQGYDVYLYSTRGGGREPYIADADNWGHTMDHFAAFDAPALIEGIAQETGKKPVWLGHSMGGMILYMYLQGTTLQEQNGRYRMVTDPELAERRNQSIAAGVAMASPAAFWWPVGAPYGSIMTSAPLRMGIQGLVKLLRNLPPDRQQVGLLRQLGRVAEFMPRLIVASATSPAMFIYYNPKNVDPDVVTLMAQSVLDNLSAKMTIQLLEDVLEGDCKDYDREYSYTSNMDRVTAPMLFITGDRDYVNCDQVRRYGFDAIRSEVKEFKCFEGFGHTDLVMGKNVEQKVYPTIVEWLQKVLAS